MVYENNHHISLIIHAILMAQ